MKKDLTEKRIERIYDILSRGNYVTAEYITEILGEPKGTISPFLSEMVKTKSVLNHNHRYCLPYPQKSVKQAADEIRLLRKNNPKKTRKIKKAQYQITDENEAQLKIEIEKTRSEIRELLGAHAVEIQAAITLLKNNGYKIMQQITEFKEI